MSPQAASSATAMGRSNPVPSLRRSAGARFTVMRFEGSRKPRLRTAAPTRTSASCTAPPASPVSWVRGKPEAASTSTSTGMAATPSRAEERTRTNIGRGDEQGSCRGRGASELGRGRGRGRAADRRGSLPAYFILARRSLASAWYDLATASVTPFSATRAWSVFLASAGFLASTCILAAE